LHPSILALARTGKHSANHKTPPLALHIILEQAAFMEVKVTHGQMLNADSRSVLSTPA
jgi:hypothetical protein